MPEPAGNSLSKKATDQEKMAEECHSLEAAIAALRANFEQYFLGIERQPPTQAYADLKRRMARLQDAFVRQTGLKFRISTLQAKFSSYDRLWHRTLQEIENGTYRRDLFKAKLHAKQRQEQARAAEQAKGKPPDPAAEKAPEKSADDLASSLQSLAKGASPAAPAKPAVGAKPAAKPAGPTAAELSEARLRAVYEAYVTAKKRCNEDVSRLDYQSVAASLRKQVPELLKKHNAKGVDFKVVIKDGKASLRAVPKE